MQEIISQLRIILWMVLHHRWIALMAASLTAIAGWVAVEFVPDTYEVNSKVYLDTASVLQPLLRGLAVENTLREQSAAVVQRTLVTRPNVLELIRATDLDLTVNDEIETERLIQSITERIVVSGGGNRKRGQENLYSVSFTDSSPDIAHAVVSELLNVFLEKTLGITRQDSSGAAVFLDRQIDEYEDRLEAAEDRLKSFKMRNSGILPDQATSFYARLETANRDLQAAKLELVEASRRLSGIEEELKTVSSTLAVEPDEVAAGVALSPLQERIQTVQQSLDEYQLRFTDKHPDVIAARRMLDQLLAKQARQNKAALDGDVDGQQLAANPAYQQLAVVKGQVKAAVSALEARVAELTRRRDDMQGQVETIPELEAELTKLDRDYAVTRQTYDELVKRRESARIAQKADESSDKVQFRIVEPPVFPVLPIGPNRPMMVIAVFLAALGAGGGLAFLLAQLKPAYYTADQITAGTDWPVLGAVSMVWSEQQIATRRRGLALFLMLSGVLVLLFFGNLGRVFFG